MRVHHRLYRWAQAHPGRVDALTALGLLLFLSVPYTLAFRPRELLFSALVVAPLGWRRTRPVASGAAVAGVCLIEVVLGSQPVMTQALALATVYSLAAYAPRWASIAGLVAALIGGFLFVLRYFVLPMTANAYLSTGEAGVRIPVQLVGAVAIGAVVLVAWTLGDLARARRLAVQALEDRARRLEVEREQERGLAAADERSRIAREMHDIVAHSLSVIIAQADGARYAAVQDPALAVSALGTISETGRGSLREMRRLLGILRADGAAPTRPLPTLDDVPGLLDAVRRSGLVVAFDAGGPPRGSLPVGAELTAYRVVQESLTNVLKHAGPKAAASVVERWTGRGLELDVTDDGRGAAADLAGGNEGQGLRGMAERVALYDGSVDAGPLPGGGFRVRAFIPYTEA